MDAEEIGHGWKLALQAASDVPDSLSRSGQNCADEPIRIPGSIQRHGFLLLLDDRDEHVVAASQNTEDFLEVPLGLILGTSVETILEREVLGALRALTHSSDDEGLLTYLGSFQMRGQILQRRNPSCQRGTRP